MKILFFIGVLFLLDEDEDEDEDQLLRRSGKLLAAHSDCLPRGILDIRQLKHGNQARPAKVRLFY